MRTAHRDPHRVRVTAIAELSRLRASSRASSQRPTLTNLNMHRPLNSATRSANGSEVLGLRMRPMRRSPTTMTPVGAIAPRAPPSPLTQRPFSWKLRERKRQLYCYVACLLSAPATQQISESATWRSPTQRRGRPQPCNPVDSNRIGALPDESTRVRCTHHSHRST